MIIIAIKTAALLLQQLQGNTSYQIQKKTAFTNLRQGLLQLLHFTWYTICTKFTVKQHTAFTGILQSCTSDGFTNVKAKQKVSKVRTRLINDRE